MAASRKSNCFADAMFFYFASLILLSDLVYSNDLSHGWNDHINWVKLDEGLQLSKDNNKPLMLVIHKSWCGACKSLKPKFEASKEIEELSQNFVMVNTLDDEEPSDKKYSVDGSYIPRVLFLDPEGNVKETIYNRSGNPSYKFYYYDPKDIVQSMETAMVEIMSDVTKRVADEL